MREILDNPSNTDRIIGSVRKDPAISPASNAKV
jgi:hypothetical protein